MKESSLISICSSVLIMLWVYAALTKLFNYDQSRNQMMAQVFPAAINKMLVWAVPVSELFIATLLLFSRWRKQGLLASAVLLFAFSIYIILVMNRSFGRIPCSCGGIISMLSWGEHLVFNLVFLLLTLAGVFYEIKKGGYMGKGK